MADSTSVLAGLLLTANSAGNAAQANDLFNAVSPAAFGAQNPETTTGLTWGYIGGWLGDNQVANGTVTLTDNDDNYIVAAIATGVVSVSTATTNWDNDTDYLRLYQVTTVGGAIDEYEDRRQVLGGGGGGSAPTGPQIPQNSQSTAYTLVLGDAGKHILHPTADNNARTFTIPANSSVAYDIGTAITFVNQINTVTIAITSDTLVLAGAGATGSRTLAANGIATALKIASTTWIISGTGLT